MKTINYTNQTLELIDQTKLPTEKSIFVCKTYLAVADAITNMIVRGVPAIGITASYGIAMGVSAITSSHKDTFSKEFYNICDIFSKTRPTAVNLFWAINRMKKE